MRSKHLRVWVVAVVTLYGFCTAFVHAQDEADAPAVAVKPRPAEIMPLSAQRMALAMANTGQHLIAVGERGQILVSNDGASWGQVAVPVRATLTAVKFVDEQNGWAVGHDATILYTNDGGRSWMLQNFEPELEQAFLDVQFVDAQHGYAVGAFGLFYSTDDGGANWTEVDAPSIREEGLYFHSIISLGDGSLFVSGETGMLGVSSPDRSNWTRLESPYEGTFFGALPHGEKGAIVFGLRGNAFVTDDVRSNRWRPIDTHTVASLFGATLLPDGGSVLVGASGVVLQLDAQAQNATPIESGVPKSLTSVLPFKSRLLVSGEPGPTLIASGH
jgi:photosystem II stability/assembly factor-like uncharacterized protein